MKYLWRILIRGVPGTFYVVAQNVQSATAAAHANSQVLPEHVAAITRVDEWDSTLNQTIVTWPEPPPPPDPDQPPPQ